MMGTSAALTSTTTLSTPRPANADIRCSMVETRASPAVSTVPRRVSPTWVASAGISTGGERSLRRNTMPVSGGAGSSVIAMRDPLCRPTPVAPMRVFRVRCANMARKGTTVAGEDGYRSISALQMRSAADDSHDVRTLCSQSRGPQPGPRSSVGLAAQESRDVQQFLVDGGRTHAVTHGTGVTLHRRLLQVAVVIVHRGQRRGRPALRGRAHR